MVVELPRWLHQLRSREVVSCVQGDLRSRGDSVLGVSAEVARQAVEWGQADFDESWGTLSCNDRVLLYAYFFQLGHLEELIAAFRQLFAVVSPEQPVVVDLGCGPFTGGLAIASELGHEASFDYLGVDRSRTMREFGERLASAAEMEREMPQICRRWSPDISSIQWDAAPGWRPVIVIVSYLLASNTLDVEQLVVELRRLLDRLGGGHVTLLYTNSPRRAPNRNFEHFSNALAAGGFALSTEDIGEIEIERPGYATSRKLRYALFYRQQLGTLDLEGA